jgi:hypothetical protein
MGQKWRCMAAFRKFKIDWRMKALAYRAFDTMPLGRQTYYLTQKHVTKTVPRVLSPTAETGFCFSRHFATFRRQFGDISGARYFEFGAGWDLYSNLVQWCLGVNRQIVVDRSSWLRPENFNVVARHLAADPPAGHVRLPTTMLSANRFEKELLAIYGIDYRAPADATQTRLPDQSIDLVATTSVLEHIPGAPLSAIMKEIHRLCHSGSVVSHAVDYSDHYSHSDAAITPYNFLQFSEQTWRRFNPDIHYQNRWRHARYRQLFRDTGFEIIHEETVIPDDAERGLRKIRLHPEFASMAAADVIPTSGYFVLCKRR